MDQLKQAPVKAKRGRKRRREPDVPCDDCIRRAAESKHKGGVGLCENCSINLSHSQALKIEIPEQRPIKQLKSSRSSQPALSGTSRPSLSGTSRHSNTYPPISSRKDDRVDSANDIDFQVPAEFLSLKEAQSYLEPIHNRLASLVLHAESKSPLHRQVVSNQERRLHFSIWLDLWEAAFTSYLSKFINTFNENQHKAAMTLKAHHLMAESFAKVQLVDSRFLWSAFNDKFKAIIDLAASVIGMSSTHAGIIVTSSATELNIFDPLYEVYVRSAHLSHREAAASLLAKIKPEQYHFSGTSATSPNNRQQKQPARSKAGHESNAD